VCEITPGLPALACPPISMSAPAVESRPVDITIGLGHPRIRIAAVSRSHGRMLPNRLPLALVHHERAAPPRRAPPITAFTSRVRMPR
jgi:hypothetical protein